MAAKGAHVLIQYFEKMWVGLSNNLASLDLNLLNNVFLTKDLDSVNFRNCLELINKVYIMIPADWIGREYHNRIIIMSHPVGDLSNKL